MYGRGDGSLVTLDVTNTCIRVVKSVGYHYARVAEEFGMILEVSRVDAAFKAVYKKTNATFPNFGCHHGISCSQWWQKVVTQTLTNAASKDEELRSDVVASVFDKLYSDFCGASTWEVFPDVHPTLEQLKAAGLSLGVVSNFDDRLGTVLSNLDLSKYFDFIFASYEVGCAKPDPRIFELALKKAAIDGSKAVHIGNSYVLDYAAAQNAGMKSLLLVRNDIMCICYGCKKNQKLSVGLFHTGARNQEAEVIHTLTDLLERLEQL